MCVQKYLSPRVSNCICSHVTNRIMSVLVEQTLQDFHHEGTSPNPKYWHLRVLSWKAALPEYEIVAEASFSYKCLMRGTTLKNGI